MNARTFRREVKRYRKARNWDHARLAEAVQSTKSKIQQVESGQIPTMELAIDLAIECGMDLGKVMMWVYEEIRGRPPRQSFKLPYESRYTESVFEALFNAQSRVWISGIGNLRKVRNPMGSFRELIGRGGHLHVAFLDPTSEAFIERRKYESIGDKEFLYEEGLVTLRMNYEVMVSVETLKGLWSHCRAMASGGNVEARLYDEPSRLATIIIVDRTVAYRYVYREKHEGERELVEICWNCEDELFRDIEEHFKTLWSSGKKIALDDFVDSSFMLPPLKLAEESAQTVYV